MCDICAECGSWIDLIPPVLADVAYKGRDLFDLAGRVDVRARASVRAKARVKRYVC